jgi:hypothetical protein
MLGTTLYGSVQFADVWYSYSGLVEFLRKSAEVVKRIFRPIVVIVAIAATPLLPAASVRCCASQDTHIVAAWCIVAVGL